MKKVKKVWGKHIIKEGSRVHVLHWDTNGVHCSEPNCEINKKEPKVSQSYEIKEIFKSKNNQS